VRVIASYIHTPPVCSPVTQPTEVVVDATIDSAKVNVAMAAHYDQRGAPDHCLVYRHAVKHLGDNN
jgi:hypothetical protein